MFNDSHEPSIMSEPISEFSQNFSYNFVNDLGAGGNNLLSTLKAFDLSLFTENLNT